MDVVSILGTVGGLIGSAASGGIFGLLGNGIKSWFDQKAEQAKMNHEIKMREMDQQEITLEHSLKMKEIEEQVKGDIAKATQSRMATEANAAAEVDKAAIGLRQASYEMDKATYGGGFVDIIRGMMRPVLTLYFAVLMSLIAWELMKINDGQFVNPTEAQAMFKDVINAIIFLATTSVTWWFGSRPNRRK